ncbi:hypothetical protein BGX28_009045 [Mortierella sp. GBA30]|nr:hypothetical protein BGX28_009045 [Mortierella sp. GBA30]
MELRTVHLPRPNCFCGFLATAIYPDPDSDRSDRQTPSTSAGYYPLTGDAVWAGTAAGSGWPFSPSPQFRSRKKKSPIQEGELSSFVLKANWVYECHFTPRQEGMVTPDPCQECDENHVDKSPSNKNTAADPPQNGWFPGRTGTLDDYYNPENIDNIRWFSPVAEKPSGWDNIDTAGNDRERDEFVDHQTKHDPWDHPLSLTASASAEIGFSVVDTSFFSTAAPRQNKAAREPESAQPYTLPEVGTPNKESIPSTPGSGYSQGIRVCGFHMHALEWHSMQELSLQEVLMLTQRANCPIFNLSVTRWFKLGINHLPMEPFNTVSCFCGDPMVISTELRHVRPHKERYDLVCPNRSPFLARLDFDQVDSPMTCASPTKEQGIEDNDPKATHCGRDLHRPKISCSRVIQLESVRYIPRTIPVHMSIENDEWLDRLLRPNLPPLPSQAYFEKKPEGWGQKTALKRRSYRYPNDFSSTEQPRPRTAPKFVSFCIWNTEHEPNSHADSREDNEPSLLDWKEDWIAEHFLEEDDSDVWDEQCLLRLDEVGFMELSRSVQELAEEAVIADAYKYVEKLASTFQDEISKCQAEIQRMNIALEEEKAAHAVEVRAVTEMEANASTMPRFKCRICYEGTITHAIIPCYHLNTCGDCATRIVWCPICRARKTGIQRIAWG